ncbi:MAG: T9SS type A sorting domain-containing protein [Flavobacteriales bacterium]|nr:T9SS type A sorting domain-containing protein [Flavobacteriales bacterium]
MKRWLLSLFMFTCAASLVAQTNITILFSIQHATCGNETGSILASVFGGSPPYSIMWSPTPPSGQGTFFISDALPGIHTITVFDSNGNEVSASAEVLLIPGLFPDVVPIAPVWSCDATCNGSFNQFIPINGGVMPYTTTFDPPGPTGGGSPNGLYFNGLCPGNTYTVTIADANGCTGVVGPLEVIGDMAPQLLSTNATASCGSGNTGSLELLFANMDSVIVSGPGGTVNVASSNPWVANNLTPGTYSISAWFGTGISDPPGGTGPSCSANFTAEVPLSTDPCGPVTGVVFADLNGDCDQDAADLGLPYRVVQITPGNNYQLTDANGHYGTELFYDDYALDASIAGYDVLCPTLPANFSINAGTPSATIDVAMSPQFGPDASVHLSAGIHRPGFPVSYTITINNQGPYTFSDLALNLSYSTLFSVNDDGGGTLVGQGQIEWNIPSLGGFSSQTYTVWLQIPPTPSITGTVVNGIATISGAVADADPTNDSYTTTSTIVNAYDPNDKLLQTSSALSESIYFIDQDLWVDYTIRFQNTGTAEAVNVYLLDTITIDFDLASLQILGASHAFEASLKPGRVLRFDFPNIMLPDSTADLEGSQGFASFRIRTQGAPLPGTLLRNAADIFFDFNEPIRTNNADLIAEMSVGLAQRTNNTVITYPNPVQDHLRVMMPLGMWNAQVLTMDGRCALMVGQVTGGTSISVDQLAGGSYVLHLHNANGEVMHTRFVKQ